MRIILLLLSLCTKKVVKRNETARGNDKTTRRGKTLDIFQNDYNTWMQSEYNSIRHERECVIIIEVYE